MRFLRRRSIIPFLVFVAAMALRIANPTPVQALRNLVFDSFERWAPRTYHDAGVRIVDIDDESLAHIGQWPWPRVEVADLIDKLYQLGAATVVFDSIFAEPDRTSPNNILPLWQRFTKQPLPFDLTSAMPDYDDVLAQAIARGPTVMGIALTDRTKSAPRPLWGMAIAGADVSRFLTTFDGALQNLPALQSRATGLGVLNSDPDTDGVIRSVPLVFGLRSSADIYPALSIEALRVASRASTYILQGSGASGISSFGENVGLVAIRIGNFVIPTDARGRIALYDTGSEAQRTVSAWQVLEGKINRGQIAGNIVFIGSSATGLADLRTTPLRPLVAGVEIHAQAIEQIVLGSYLLRPNWMTGLELTWMTILCGFLLWALSRVGPISAAGIGAAVVTVSFASSWIAFRRLGLLVDPVYPALGALALYLTQSLLQFVRTEHDRRYLKGAFGRYVSPALLDQLVQDSSRLQLGGEMREMSILFCDIRNFTSLAETMDAQALTRFVNSFLTPMTERILAHRGTIDKYIGDCVMAFWNAPLAEPLHAEYAVRAGLDMVKTLASLNEVWRKQAADAGRPFAEVAVGIGIATGQCCVGNLGSDQRFDYSVLGDDVNLASRLEAQTKVYGTPIIVSEATNQRLPRFATIELDVIRVKGKSRPTRIFAVIGDENVAHDEWFLKLADKHSSMIEEFRQEHWAQAMALLSDLRSLAPRNMVGIYDFYAGRAEHFANAAPGG